MQFIKSFFTFINDQFLRMTWLDQLVRFVLKDIFKMNQDSMIFESVSFFIYDVIKIFILLSVLIFLASYIQSFFSPEKTKRILSKELLQTHLAHY